MIQSTLLNGIATSNIWFSNATLPSGNYVVTFNGSSPNFYTLSLSSTTGQILQAGQIINFLTPSTASPANAGLNIIGAGGAMMPSTGAYYIKANNAPLVAGQIPANTLVSVMFDGTGFQVLSPGAPADGSSSITTVGTVTSGVWAGSVIQPTYLATPLIVAFGDGSDGAQNWTSNQSLTRDWFCATLTVSSGVTVAMNGYKIFCRGLASINGAIFTCNGNPGSGATGGTYTAFTCSTLIGGPGASGGTGVGSSTSQYSFIAGAGVGGAGSGGSGSAGAGGTSSSGYQVSTAFSNLIHTLDSLKNLQGTTLYNPYSLTVFPVFAAAGGGAGAGNGGSAGGGGGGGAGSCILALHTISGSFTMEAIGGAGANASASGIGGGGGGNGGLCGLVTTTTSPSVTTLNSGGAGGTGGGGAGTAGVAGSGGQGWVLIVP